MLCFYLLVPTEIHYKVVLDDLPWVGVSWFYCQIRPYHLNCAAPGAVGTYICGHCDHINMNISNRLVDLEIKRIYSVTNQLLLDTTKPNLYRTPLEAVPINPLDDVIVSNYTVFSFIGAHTLIVAHDFLQKWFTIKLHYLMLSMLCLVWLKNESSLYCLVYREYKYIPSHSNFSVEPRWNHTFS